MEDKENPGTSLNKRLKKKTTKWDLNLSGCEDETEVPLVSTDDEESSSHEDAPCAICGKSFSQDKLREKWIRFGHVNGALEHQQARAFGQNLNRPNQQPHQPANFGQYNKPVEQNSQPSSLVGLRSAGFGQHLDRPVAHKTGNEYNYDKQSTNYYNGKESKILRYESEQDPEQGYKFAYHTSDGNEEVQRSEEAEIKRIDEEHAIVAVQGVVEYVNREGKRVRWTYTADENGYHPSEITVT
ncbi:unnamed protein product [Diabrotica balteata]|uniref:Uncharacterized protein n=1 Tax=Diabrotica balteata TaxID=107213 RepID=A0A9N9SRD6_DIABA|nr:unnamed protein product [Diabrotica balteata]